MNETMEVTNSGDSADTEIGYPFERPEKQQLT